MNTNIAILSTLISLTVAQYPTCSGLNIGAATQFSVYSDSTFDTPGSSDIQGSIAIRSSINIGDNYSIGALLSSDNVAVECPGSLNWPGNNVNGGTNGHPMKIGSESTFNFDQTTSQLKSLSNELLNSPSIDGFSYVSFQNDLKTTINSIGSNMGNVIINVPGTSLNIQNDDYTSSCSNGNNIIFNFYEATTVSTSNIKLCGSIIALNADYDGASMLFEGSLYVKSFTDKGYLQVNLKTIPDVCINTPTPSPPAPEPYVPPVPSPPAPQPYVPPVPAPEQPTAYPPIATEDSNSYDSPDGPAYPKIY